ncbi:type IV secretion system DNA-binding domain-containing protein [Burkholderia cenocepacia]|uniref:type IV secretion system DNA-binding domain-containing protein n=1 Tax=Burkholderia cenocepacia TaxID=95486 RepID=UPI002865F5D8|nr:type IV secretion system DNA-binding domain-containing protein [Burkholderia cenocepacia]MDR8076752.1 type IV secretion system DNA-binding domain-containing protein [Burkholderia cenocepacia]
MGKKNNKKIVYKYSKKRVIDPDVYVVDVYTALVNTFLSLIFIPPLILFFSFIIPVLLPPSPFSEIEQIKIFYQVWLAKITKWHFLTGHDYNLYFTWFDQLQKDGILWRLSVRWYGTIIISAVLLLYIWKSSLKPTINNEQTGGKILYQFEDAFDNLKSQFDNQLQNTRNRKTGEVFQSFPLETTEGLNILEPETYAKVNETKNDVIYMPDGQRRMHFLVIGSSRRGKTQWLLKRLMWIYLQIRMKKQFKLLLLETPKDDYSNFIRPEYQHVLSLDDKASVAWDIGYDFELVEDVLQFFQGKINTDVSQPFFPEATIQFLTAAGAYLIHTCGNTWDFAAFCSVMLRPNAKEKLKEIIQEHYPIAMPLIEMQGDPISSVMGQMANSIQDLMKMAEVYNGYQYKKDIEGFNFRMLSTAFNRKRLATILIPLVELNGEKEVTLYDNIHANYLLTKFLDKFEGANWSELAAALQSGLSSYTKPLSESITKTDAKLFSKRTELDDLIRKLSGMELSKQITYEKALQEFTDIVFTPYQKAIVCAIIRKRKFAITWKEVLEFVNPVEQESKNNLAKEFVSAVFGYCTSQEIKGFLSDDTQSILLNGVKPILQWHEIWDKYERTERLSIRDWVLDENPDKKILTLKMGARFSTITQPIIKGILFYIKSLVLDRSYPNDLSDAVPLRNFWIFADEFQEMGNMEQFIAPMLALAAARGISLLIACQDTAQLQKIYGPEMVQFLLSNIGNLVLLGVNNGETAQRLADFLGKKDIKKLGINENMQVDGVTYSTSYSQHNDDSFVIRPNEFNSKLGLDINNDPNEETLIRYLYVPSHTDGVFLMTTPPTKYKVVNKSIAPDWMKSSKLLDPLDVDIEAIQADMEEAEQNEQAAMITYTPISIAPRPMPAGAPVATTSRVTHEEGYDEQEDFPTPPTPHVDDVIPPPPEEESLQDKVATDLAITSLGGHEVSMALQILDQMAENKKTIKI